ncbi:MAG TPA: DoxX family protein [Cyclobacteriaceae bacterium]
MSKRNKIIYWIATPWLALGMASTGIVQMMKTPEEIELMNRIGFPVYFLTIIGVWKLLGVVAVLVPKFPLVKEWAYAGFFFTMSGAIFCHLAVGDGGAADYFGPGLLLVLTVVSWYFRPAERRLVPMN